MFSFHVDPDLDILTEKLTVQIGARPGLKIQLFVKDPDDLWFNVAKTWSWDNRIAVERETENE